MDLTPALDPEKSFATYDLREIIPANLRSQGLEPVEGHEIDVKLSGSANIEYSFDRIEVYARPTTMIPAETLLLNEDALKEIEGIQADMPPLPWAFGHSYYGDARIFDADSFSVNPEGPLLMRAIAAYANSIPPLIATIRHWQARAEAAEAQTNKLHDQLLRNETDFNAALASSDALNASLNLTCMKTFEKLQAAEEHTVVQLATLAKTMAGLIEQREAVDAITTADTDDPRAHHFVALVHISQGLNDIVNDITNALKNTSFRETVTNITT